MAEYREIDLTQIILDGDVQPRVQMDMFVVDEYAQAMRDNAIFPPIDVFEQAGQYWCADGFHRVMAAQQMGREVIAAQVHAGGKRAAILFAVGANGAHGVRRTNADKRRAVEKLLTDVEWRQWSDREIARWCKVTHPFVIKLRAELSGNDYQIERKVARNGTVYVMNTERIGKDEPVMSEPAPVQVGRTEEIVPSARKLLHHTPIAEDRLEIRRMARLNPELQVQLAEKIAAGEAEDVSAARRALKRDEGTLPLPPRERVQVWQEKWQVQSGDMWEIPGRGGTHRLLCGDCTASGNLARLCGDMAVDAVITDPPYGKSHDADYSGMINDAGINRDRGLRPGNEYAAVVGDVGAFDAAPVQKLVADITEQFWFGADYYAATLGDTMQAGSWLVWDKRVDENLDRMFGAGFELIWSATKHQRVILRYKWAGVFGTEHEPQRGRVHPTQKPVILIEGIITRYLSTTQVILDPYAGSGTLLVACERLGKCALLCEVSPEYGAAILARTAQMGLEPYLIREEVGNQV